jgi:hypothetical protein
LKGRSRRERSPSTPPPCISPEKPTLVRAGWGRQRKIVRARSARCLFPFAPATNALTRMKPSAKGARQDFSELSRGKALTLTLPRHRAAEKGLSLSLSHRDGEGLGMGALSFAFPCLSWLPALAIAAQASLVAPVDQTDKRRQGEGPQRKVDPELLPDSAQRDQGVVRGESSESGWGSARLGSVKTPRKADLLGA